MRGQPAQREVGDARVAGDPALHPVRLQEGVAELRPEARYNQDARAITAKFALGPERENLLLTEPDLQEIAHGEWEGLLASEIQDKDPARLRAWREEPDTVLMPGGESLRQVLDRSWRGLANAMAGLGDEDTLLVVAHDAVNRVILCRILGLPIGKLWTFRQAPTTLNLLEGDSPDTLEVVRELDLQLVASVTAYRCNRCGFGARAHHWQCPSCKNWGTIRPVHDAIGE